MTLASRGVCAGLLMALCLPTVQAGDVQQRIQWDSSLSVRGLTLLENAQLVSWQADYYADTGWSANVGLQRSVLHPVGTQRLGLTYSRPTGLGEVQLGWQSQRFNSGLGLYRWNYQQFNAIWLAERCLLGASWTLESSSAARFGYKGLAMDLACVQPIAGGLGLELGVGAMGLGKAESQHYGHAGLDWRHERIEVRLLYSGSGGASRDLYPVLARARWSATAAWNF